MREGHSVVFSIDPGFGGTGLCMFVNKKLYKFSNIKSGKSDTDRYVDIASKCATHAMAWISDLLSAASSKEEMFIRRISIVIESPHAMGGVKGRASLMRGDVFKVAKLAGAIGAVMHLYLESYTEGRMWCADTDIHIYYPDVRAWKGQVTKETTQRRVLRDVTYAVEYIKDRHYKLKPEYPDHVFDAAGIGLWFINKTIMGAL